MIKGFSKLKLIVGLGNPGAGYEHTYHNAGKLFAEYFRNAYADGNSIIAVAPNSFMNASGAEVANATHRFRVKPDELLVAHDDSDLELGKYKLSFGSRAAGHHGVESVIAALGTKDFWRLRIGIRPYPHKSASNQNRSAVRPKAAEFVLKRINTKDKKILDKVFENAAHEIKMLRPLVPDVLGRGVKGLREQGVT